MTLFNAFCTLMNTSRNIANNGYLQLLTPYIEDIETAAVSNATISDYCGKLTALLNDQNLFLNGKKNNEFVQLFGEAHFATLCLQCHITLNKIPEQKNKKTPDFLFSTNQQNIYFEVKTLSVVNGALGINKDLLESLDTQIDIDRQIKNGDKFAIGVSERRPFAEKPFDAGCISAVVSTLIEKTRQNIKSGQFANPNTFLVLNLCLIPPSITDNRILRPAYCDDHIFHKAITGDLWMLAFGQTGMLVHGQPEFEGKPCIEGILDKSGILVDTSYEDVSGLIIVVYPLNKKPHIYGLYRSKDYIKWLEKNHTLSAILTELNGNNWNDETDSNSWQLNG